VDEAMAGVLAGSGKVFTVPGIYWEQWTSSRSVCRRLPVETVGGYVGGLKVFTVPGIYWEQW